MQPSLLLETPKATTLEFNLDNVGSRNYLTHNFHPYPAKFIPQIPGAILDYYAPPCATVLDPFCGSGTAVVEATLRGHHCMGSDINPIATLIASAKTATLSETDKRELRQLLYRLAPHVAVESPQLELPSFRNRDLWFSRVMLNELGAILHQINSLKNGSPAELLARCAFSAIVVKCSNQESETHWRSVNKGLKRGFALESFALKLSDMVSRSIDYASIKNGTADVKKANASALKFIPDESVDIVVTSPPYANSHDYYLYNKLRMFWLGYDHYAVQAAEIGSRHRHSDLKEPIDIYLMEIRAALEEMARVLKVSGKVAIVVGDSIYRGALVDMGAEYIRLGSAVGLREIYHYEYDQRQYTSAFQRGFKTLAKRSHILVFDKKGAS